MKLNHHSEVSAANSYMQSARMAPYVTERAWAGWGAKQRETLQTVLFPSYSASLLVPGGAVVAMEEGLRHRQLYEFGHTFIRQTQGHFSNNTEWLLLS